MSVVHVCGFTVGTEELRGRKLTYEAVKKIVLKAGRFSVFEATADQRRARLFTALCADPDLVVTGGDYPWTEIRRRTL